VRDEAEARRDFAARMGPAYAARHRPEEVGRHLRLAREASAARPARVSVEAGPGGRLDVTVVGLDFFAEFALLCGVLSARSLDIESGQVHTSAPRAPGAPPGGFPRRRPAPPPDGLPSRIIVDEFRVIPRGPATGGTPSRLEELLETDVNELLSLVAHGRAEEARERLDRRLAERFARSEPPAGALQPLEIAFDNDADPRWTRMEVRGPDTPGFLYALATGLALRDIYVQEVDIASVGSEARDRFLIATRDGRKVEDAGQILGLRAAVALIKQFAHLLPLAPDPALALRSFGQLVDRLLAEPSPARALEHLAAPDDLRQLARLLGASTFLWEDFLRLQAEHLLPVLDSWRRRPLRGRDEIFAELDARVGEASSFGEKRRALNELKDEEMLLVDMRHLLDPRVDLAAFSGAITDLAAAVVEKALAVCLEKVAGDHGLPRDERGEACPVAVVGLGKFGGREMGYASDIELVFVYGAPSRTEKTGIDAGIFFEEVVRELTGLIAARQEGIFHVDLRLRPHGAKGPLASPLAAVREYYRPGGGAAPFERQALVKLRRVAGDVALGKEVERVRDAFVWGDEPWDRGNALHLRDRQCRELVPPGRFNVKYSPGALVEVEYAVQYLQIEHGRELPALRTPSTLEGLDRLGEAGLVGPDERARLRAAYVFWRVVADALRMVRGNARDLLLPGTGSEEMRFLARRLGYPGPGWEEAARAFLDDVARHRDAVSRFFTDRFRR
jgi:[glutamine synthetase] adenylyltransferase / [glutamine synthetase]-adenylyl-L-tyrosine phosphorylase